MAILRKKYYFLPKENSTSKKMKAPCLRMAGSFKKYSIYCHQNKIDQYGYVDDFENEALAKNKYYQQMNSEYASDYDELMRSYDCFLRYFQREVRIKFSSFSK